MVFGGLWEKIAGKTDVVYIVRIAQEEGEIFYACNPAREGVRIGRSIKDLGANIIKNDYVGKKFELKSISGNDIPDGVIDRISGYVKHMSRKNLLALKHLQHAELMDYIIKARMPKPEPKPETKHEQKPKPKPINPMEEIKIMRRKPGR